VSSQFTACYPTRVSDDHGEVEIRGEGGVRRGGGPRRALPPLYIDRRPEAESDDEEDGASALWLPGLLAVLVLAITGSTRTGSPPHVGLLGRANGHDAAPRLRAQVQGHLFFCEVGARPPCIASR
jgi:hypothetical protein